MDNAVRASLILASVSVACHCVIFHLCWPVLLSDTGLAIADNSREDVQLVVQIHPVLDPCSLPTEVDQQVRSLSAGSKYLLT